MARKSRIHCAAQMAGKISRMPPIAFTAIGASRAGYDWHRHTVSSLGDGDRGWQQRANFVLTGVLYSCAARGLSRCPRRTVYAGAVPALVAAAGIGLIGSGVFVTDPMGGFPPVESSEDGSNHAALDTAPTREGTLHNVCAIPIFAGIPVAGLASAVVAARRRDYGWATFSAASSLLMLCSFVLIGRAFGGMPRFAGKGGLFQRISIASGFG